jgi:hypothetical protein
VIGTAKLKLCNAPLCLSFRYRIPGTGVTKIYFESLEFQVLYYDYQCFIFNILNKIIIIYRLFDYITGCLLIRPFVENKAFGRVQVEWLSLTKI